MAAVIILSDIENTVEGECCEPDAQYGLNAGSEFDSLYGEVAVDGEGGSESEGWLWGCSYGDMRGFPEGNTGEDSDDDAEPPPPHLTDGGKWYGAVAARSSDGGWV